MNEIPVLFENDFCVVFNKPSGLPVQGGKGIKVSLDSILAEKYPARPFLVHRLDRDTSGIILVAKTKETAAAFSALFAGKGRLLKQYLAICAGIPDPPEGLIRLALEVRQKPQRTRLQRNSRRLDCMRRVHTPPLWGVIKGMNPETNTLPKQPYPVRSAAGLVDSKTFYRMTASASAGGEPCSLLELEPGSGRMHQIRRHLSAIGHPVLGDDKYGDFSLNKRLKKTAKLRRLLLHSHRFSIQPFPPFLPRGLEIEVPPPEHFTDFRLDNGLSFFP